MRNVTHHALQRHPMRAARGAGWPLVFRLLRALVAAGALAALGPAVLVVPAAAQDTATDAAFLDGLRERQLFRLAEAYCRQRLSDSQLPVSQRANLTVQLSQTIAEHARQSSPSAAEPLWAQASQVCDDFTRQYPNSSWAVVVQVQAALVRLARGEAARQRAELTGNPQSLVNEAREHLRAAVRLLREHGDAVAELLRQPVRPPRAGSDDLDRGDLLNLQKHLRYQLALAYCSQGQAYPPETPDRDNALRQAIELLSQLARMSTVDPLAWQARVDEAFCLRLMKNYVQATRKLDDLLKEPPPPKIALHARAERVRLLLEQGRTPEALKLLEQGRRQGQEISGELDFAHLEAYVQAWQEAIRVEDKPRAAQWEAQATALVKEIEVLHAPYWGHRAEALLARAMSGAGQAGDLELLIRAAQALYRSDQLDEALARYDEAADRAASQKLLDQAFDLAYNAAAIEHQRAKFAVAKERFRRLAMQFPQHARAAEAHLLAIFNAAQQIRQAAATDVSEYVQLIQEHLQTWAGSATAHEARWYLGRLRQHERQYDQAIEAYAHIARDHERFAPALDAIGRCHEAALAELKAAGKPLQERATKAATFFEQAMLSADGRLPQLWSPADRAAAFWASRLRISYLGSGYDRVERILTAALQGQPKPDAGWRSTALSLLVIALAAQDRLDEAQDLLKEVAAADPRELLGMLQGLAQLAASEPAESKVRLARLQLAGVELIARHRDSFAAAERKTFDFLAARATADSGQIDAALGQFRTLAQQYPKDGDVQEALASALLESQQPRLVSEALDRFRELERNSKAGTARWFSAKYGLARCHFQMRNKRRAAEIIEITRLLHPDLGGQEMKDKFLALLKQCQ
jgi:hypothetical protein